jgi:hypothetical protein
VAPGYINTEMMSTIPEKVMNEVILPQIPVGRLGEAAEIARAVKFLASDDAGFVTGSTLSATTGQRPTAPMGGRFSPTRGWALPSVLITKIGIVWSIPYFPRCTSQCHALRNAAPRSAWARSKPSRMRAFVVVSNMGQILYGRLWCWSEYGPCNAPWQTRLPMASVKLY